MDGLCEVVRPRTDGPRLQIGDDVYILSMLSLDDWAHITDQVRRMRPDPIQVALRMIAGMESRDDKAFILEKAWSEARRSQIVPEAEVMLWAGTVPDAAAYMLWRSLLHRHPDLTLDTVASWVKPMARDGFGLGVETIARLMDGMHGLPPADPT